MTINSFDNFYASTLHSIMREKTIRNNRTGIGTKAVSGLTYSSQLFPILTLRDINIKFFCTEVIWSIAGRQDLKFFHLFDLKGWDQFADEQGNIESAYGYRWRHTFDRDQLVDLVDGLIHDPTSRHGVMITWDPRSDGLMQKNKPNIPCVVLWNFHCIGQWLNLVVVQRSADMIIGYPHDIAGAYLLWTILARKLEKGRGTLTYVVSNAHIYETHFDQATAMVGRAMNTCIEECPDLPRFDIYDSILKSSNDDEGLVKICNDVICKVGNIYAPMPRLKGMKVIP